MAKKLLKQCSGQIFVQTFGISKYFSGSISFYDIFVRDIFVLSLRDVAMCL